MGVRKGSWAPAHSRLKITHSRLNPQASPGLATATDGIRFMNRAWRDRRAECSIVRSGEPVTSNVNHIQN